MKNRNLFFILVIVMFLIFCGCATVSQSPLFHASERGDSSTVQKLINEGANVNEQDKNGYTPLMIAAWSGKTETVKVLLNRSADPEIVDCNGCTAFNYADYTNDKELIESMPKRKRKSEITCIYDPNFKPYKPTIDYTDLLIKLNYKGSGKIVLSVQDKRPYIVSGEKKLEYVGYFRNANYGTPYDATTHNKRAFYETLSSCIAESLKRAGYDVIEVNSLPTETDNVLIEKMKQYGTSKIVVVTLKEWLSEAYYNVGLTYDVGLTIIDERGATVAVEYIKGSDDLGDKRWVAEMRAKAYVPKAAEKKFEQLFNKQEIIKSLTAK